MTGLLPARVRRLLEQALAELEWRQYSDDAAAFMRDCVKVQAGKKLGGGRIRRIPLDLWDYQLDALDTFQREQFTVVLKARQLGLTTIVMAYALWMLLFEPGTSIVLVSKDQETADSALSMIDAMWQFLPRSIRFAAPTLENDAARFHSWRFADGSLSWIRSYAATETPAAGQTPALTIWDEAALARAQGDTLRTLLPLTDAGGSMIVFSTARGGSNTFATTFREAERGDSTFVPMFFPWYVSRLMNRLAHKVRSCPHGPCDECVDRTEHEAKRRVLKDEPWKFHAEYPESSDEAFRMSGQSRFAGLPPVEEFEEFPLRGRMAADEDGGVRFVVDERGSLRCRPEFLSGTPAGATSVLSVDPSQGGGGDFTAMTAGWLDEDGVPQRVAFWHANDFEPADVALEAAQIGVHLASDDGKPAILVVEKQGGYGDTILHELRTVQGYRRLYIHTYTGHRKNRRETTFGFPMTAARRPLVVDALASWLRFADELPTMSGVDPLLRNELGTFVVRDDGKVAADVGAFDDLVMSTAIWAYVLGERGTPAGGGGQAMPVRNGEDEVLQQAVVSVAGIFREMEEQLAKQQVLDDRHARRLERRMRR